jgi:hypothetical protein
MNRRRRAQNQIGIDQNFTWTKAMRDLTEKVAPLFRLLQELRN